MPTQIDLGIKFLPEEMNVYVVHSGKGRARLKAFGYLNKIFLDLPGLRLSENVFNDPELLVRHIRMSEAISDWRRQNRNSEVPLPPPVRRPSHYPLPTSPNDKQRIGYKRSAIQSFYGEIEKGDLIIVPGITAYEPFLAGFVTQHANLRETITLDELLDDPFPSRSVEWFDHDVTKKSLSSTLSLEFEKRKVVNQIDLHEHGPEIFTALFGAYVHGDSAGLDVFCPRYRGRNPLETVPVQELIAFFVAAHEMVENGQTDQLAELSFGEIISSYYGEDFVASLEHEFHSPGHFRVITRSKSLALVLSAGIALATAGCYDENSVKDISVTKSENQPLSEEEILKTLAPVIQHISPKTRKEVEQKGHAAVDDVGARTSSKVSKR